MKLPPTRPAGKGEKRTVQKREATARWSEAEASTHRALRRGARLPRQRGPERAAFGGMTMAFIGPSAREHLFALRWHIPEAAHRHAHGFALRKENLPV